MAFGVNDMTFGARDVLPVRSRTRQGHELTADELEAAAKDLDVYPPVSASISRFSETRAPGPRAAYAERHRAGCDTSAQPIYSKPPTSEPNVEDAGALWHEERGREGRRVTFHGHPPDDESGVEAELRPGEMRPAGLASWVMHKVHTTRTGLPMRKDCWGNVYSHGDELTLEEIVEQIESS